MTSRGLIITIVLLLFCSNWAYAWQPDGQVRLGYSKACHPQLWSHRYMDARGAEARSDMLKEYIDNCSAGERKGQPEGDEAERYLQELEDRERPWQRLEFIDSAGIIQSGLLLMQDPATPRPLIVVACDFDCDPRTNPWLKTVAMQLYDEGRVHVYVAISPEARLSKQNLFISGGFHYGRELLEAGRWLQLFSPMRGKFSSAHVIGMGWAGKSVLDAQIFNDHNPIADDRRVFHSTVALCPAVQLDKALSEIDNPQTAQSRELSSKIHERIDSLKNRDAGWADWFAGWQMGETVADKWINASLAQVSRPEFRWLNPFKGNPPRTPSAWLEANNFLYQSLGVRTPGWVLGSSGDPRFSADDHWRPLANQHRDLKKSNLRVVGIEDSTTCALPATHGWNFSSSLLRTLVLQEAYEIWPRYGRQIVAWTTPGTPALEPGERHVDQQWTVDSQGAITVEFFIAKVVWEERETVRAVMVSVPPAQLPSSLKFDGKNSVVATRQLNTWLRLRGESEALVQSKQDVRHLEIRD